MQRDGPIAEDAHKVGIGIYSAKLMPGTHLVRGFNAIPDKDMESQSFRHGDLVAIPLARDDAKAIAVGSDLVRQAEYLPVVVPLARASEFGSFRPFGGGVFSVEKWTKKLGLAK